MFSVSWWKYWARLRLWLHRKPVKSDLTHFAYITYSNEDVTWVIKWLDPHFTRMGLSFICAERDFVFGDFNKSVMEAVDRSFKTVFIVSRSILPSYEMHLASVYSYEQGGKSVIVWLDDTELSDLPKSFRIYWENSESLRWPNDDSIIEGDSEQSTLIEAKMNNFLNELSETIRRGSPAIPNGKDYFY